MSLDPLLARTLLAHDIDEMVLKRGPSTTVYLKVHLSFLLREGADCSDETWTEADLNKDATIISVSRVSGGSGEACPVSCAGLAPLRTILLDARVTARALLVRRSSGYISQPQRSQSPTTAAGTEHRAGEATATSAPSAAPAELWAELQVSDVRPNAHISANPALLPAWRLLLPHLVTYEREEAPLPGKWMLASDAAAPLAAAQEAAPTGRQAADDQGGADSARLGQNGSPEVRALDGVYASLKSAERWGGAEGVRMAGAGDAVAAAAAAIGPAPGASGLNAVPAAVVMKGGRRANREAYRRGGTNSKAVARAK